jgi:16S rRNA (uracil1498-N3)-methyltransferase
MLQSRQVWLPELQEPLLFERLMESTDYTQKFIAHCEDGKKNELGFAVHKNGSSILLIGPEGDFTKNEINLALANQFMPVTLGETRLRTETAGIVGATLLKFAGV